MPSPIIDNPRDLFSLLAVALEYEIQPVIDIYKKGLQNRVFIQRDPLPLYAIACACGLADQARFVATNTDFLTVTRYPDTTDLSTLLPLASYHRLVSYLAERDNKWHQTLGEVPLDCNCDCDEQLEEDFYEKIKEKLKGPYLQTEDAYLKTLEDRSHSLEPACGLPTGCSFTDSKIKAFVKRVVAKRDGVYDDLMVGKQFISPQAREEKETSSTSCE